MVAMQQWVFCFDPLTRSRIKCHFISCMILFLPANNAQIAHVYFQPFLSAKTKDGNANRASFFSQAPDALLFKLAPIAALDIFSSLKSICFLLPPNTSGPLFDSSGFAHFPVLVLSLFFCSLSSFLGLTGEKSHYGLKSQHINLSCPRDIFSSGCYA